MRTKLLSALFCGLAAFSLTACDEEPVVESTPAPAAAAVTAEDLPACCSIETDAVAAECEEASECEAASECEIDECDEMSDCDMSECSPEKLEQCKEKGVCPSEKTPE